jgi:hypothetical protein
MKQTISVYKIEQEGVFDFLPSDYSSFKFGDSLIGKKFGKALAQAFIDNYLMHQAANKKFIAYSSPYQYIPTATMTMFEEFVFQTNRWLVSKNRSVLETCRIYRNNTYSQDYGELSAAERLELIGSDLFYLDPNRAKGKTLLLLDDIKITGSHEYVLNRTLNHLNIIQETIFLYFAEMVNPGINPNIENYLNYHAIKSLNDLAQLMKSENFVFNTRAIKYMLSSNLDDLGHFISQITDNQIAAIYDLAIANNYSEIPAFGESLAYMQSKIK